MGPPNLALRHDQAPLIPPRYSMKNVPWCSCNGIRRADQIDNSTADFGDGEVTVEKGTLIYDIDDSTNVITDPESSKASSSVGNSTAPAAGPREVFTCGMAEMVLLCNEAMRRANVRATRNGKNPKCTTGGAMKAKPLSLEYMADRLDIDDPIFGYLCRHPKFKSDPDEGSSDKARTEMLQGFITCTTFTNWQRTFRWDSINKSAFSLDDDVLSKQMFNKERNVDESGALASELQNTVRLGDPWNEGIVWPRIAEVSLLGALGCGKLLLRLLIEKLEGMKLNACKDYNYDFLVLQATDNSVPFYESMGFVRVGAVTEEGNRDPAVAIAPPEKFKDRLVSSPVEQVLAKVAETPRDVARRFNVAPWDVIFLNKDLYPDITVGSKLRKGTMLYIPSSKMEQTPDSSTTMDGPVDGSAIKWYTAKENDTPRIIAQRFKVELKLIVSGNKSRLPGLLSSSRLKNGTKVKIAGFETVDDKYIPYRHWCFPDDRADDLEPSYMMALKLNRKFTANDVLEPQAVEGNDLSKKTPITKFKKYRKTILQRQTREHHTSQSMLLHRALSNQIRNEVILPKVPISQQLGTVNAVACTPSNEKKATKSKKRHVEEPTSSLRKSKKRKLLPGEPVPPKKAKGPYLQFCQDMRCLRKELLVGKHLTEQTKMLGVWWREIAPEAKDKYEEAFQEDRKKHVEFMAAYQVQLKEFVRLHPEWYEAQKPTEKENNIPKTPLSKQKIASKEIKPRNLFNKIVKLNSEGMAEAGCDYKYYYVLTYLPDLQWVHLGPLVTNGLFGDDKPKANGRSKWTLVPESENKEVDLTANYCTIVKQVRAMKRTVDADDEEWDIGDTLPASIWSTRKSEVKEEGVSCATDEMMSNDCELPTSVPSTQDNLLDKQTDSVQRTIQFGEML